MFDAVEILGATEEVDEMEKVAKTFGENVVGKSVWDGIIPPDSFISFGFYRMARPEYMAFRKANQLVHDDAVFTVAALLSDLDTAITSRGVPAGCYYHRDKPNMTPESMRRYLEPVMDTEEGRKAAEILDEAEVLLPSFLKFCEMFMEELED